MAIEEQVHDSFKVFVGGSVEEIDAQVQEFTAAGDSDAKSIGVEFLESKGRLIVSLGFRRGSEGYAGRLVSTSAGVLDPESAESREALESALASAAAGAGDVICHELYVTAAGEVHAVFLAKA